MIFTVLRKLQRHAAVVALSAASISSVSAGLFCDWRCDSMRPFYSPACEPAWGYHETCWRRFPHMESCGGWGDYCPAGQTGNAMNGDYYADGDAGVQHFEAPQMEGYPMAPMNQDYGAPVVSGAPLVVPSQTHVQQQPAPTLRYEAPATNAYDASPGQYPISPDPVPQPQDALPAPDMMAPELAPAMPPLPEPYQQSSASRYLPARGVQYTGPAQGQGMPQFYQPRPVAAPQPQNLAAPTSPVRFPVRGISFARVRPSSASSVDSYGSQAPVQRTLLQRMLPGGK